MAKVEIIAKLKQKNDADFKIADAKDIEMEDGSDLQSTIDNIKKNGTNIDTEKYATKEELETKADKEHTHDYNDITNAPEIPSIEGLATEDYVDTAIANAQLSGGEIDTSNFATKEDLNAKVDKKLGYSLVSDSEINRLSSIDNYDDTEIKNELNNKSDLGHTHSYKELSDKPTIPSIEGLATEDYVKNEIANAQLSSGEVDLSGYATKEELSVKADKIHTHTIADVDNLQTTLNNKSDLGHTHSYNDITNTPEIPSIEGLATKEELNNKVDKLEGHSLISNSEIIRLSKVDNYDDTELRNKLNNKSDKGHRHDYSEITNPPVIPSIEGLATEDYVKNEIANAQLSQGEVDLSGYATKNDLDTKVDKINGYSLVSDIEITRLSGLHNYDDTELRNKLNNKSDKGHRHDYSEISNTPTIPSIEGLATEIYVDTKIAEAQLSGGEIDLSGYVTKDELNNKADKTELHSHSNKNILDGITQDKISSWDNKSDFSGKYEDLENPPIIPTVDVNKNYVDTQLNKKVDKKNGYSLISNTEIQRLANVDNYDDSDIKNTLESKADKTELHSHNNKTVLDGITSTKIQEWNNKSDFSGKYEDLENPPTIPSLDGYATQTYVKNEIANAQLGSGQEVDLSGYATKDDLNNKADKTELHSHNNKEVLDSITRAKINSWDNKSEFSGDYNDLSNPPTIPVVDSVLSSTSTNAIQNKVVKNALDGKANNSHTHSYKNLSDKPTIPVVDSTLSSTSTNAIQNKVVTNALDGKADSSHTHNISDVTNLQTTLDNKSNTNHTHNYAGSSSAGGDATNALACSGNATTATKLQTARTINGTSFDGSSNITTSKWGTARSITIGNTTKTIDGSGNVTWTLGEIGADGGVITVSTVTELKSALMQGGIIHVEAGEYVLGANEELEYISNTHLIGIGEVTIKVNPSSSSYIALKPHLDGTETGYDGVYNTTIENIIFDGQNGTNAYGLFATAHCKNITLKKCTFLNLKNSWHMVEINSSYNTLLEDCTFEGYNVDVSDDINHTEAVQLDFAGGNSNYPFTCNFDGTGVEKVTFKRCTFEHITTSATGAIGSHSLSSTSMPRDILVEDCTFKDVDICIYAPDYYNFKANKNEIYNCGIFMVYYTTSDQSPGGVTLRDNHYNGLSRVKKGEGRFFDHRGYTNQLKDIVIENNIILNAGTHGIGVTPLVGSIERNLVRNCTKNGIYLYGYSFVSCQGNICSNNAIDIYGSNGQIGKQTYSKLCNNIAYVRTDGQQSNTVTIDNNL